MDVVPPHFIPGWIQIRLRMKGPSGDIINTFNYTPQIPGTRFDGTGLANLAGDWGNGVLPLLKPILGTPIQFIDVVARDLGDDTGAEGSFVYPANTFGTSTGELLPMNVALASTWRTHRVGRAYRGRNFWGGFTEAATNGDFFTAAFQAALVTLLTYLLNYQGPLLQSVFPVVASRTRVHLERIFGLTLTNIMDSMKRRLAGRGR